jgi:hypothetical protein
MGWGGSRMPTLFPHWWLVSDICLRTEFNKFNLGSEHGSKEGGVRTEGWKGLKGGRVLQTHRRPAGNCKIKTGLRREWHGDRHHAGPPGWCRPSCWEPYKRLVLVWKADSSSSDALGFSRICSSWNWNSETGGGPDMRQILICYATVHLILLALSVRCDGT